MVHSVDFGTKREQRLPSNQKREIRRHLNEMGKDIQIRAILAKMHDALFDTFQVAAAVAATRAEAEFDKEAVKRKKAARKAFVDAGSELLELVTAEKKGGR